MNYVVYPAHLLVFGFAVSAALGLFASWVDRRVTARVQYRVGPPILQPAYDLVKLLGKETLIPAGASRAVFLGAPLAGLAGAGVVSALLWATVIWPDWAFVGDLVVVLYLLVVPSLCIIVGGFASRNPLASLGASREMKLLVGYELPFLVAVLVPVIQSGLTLRLGAIVEHQAAHGATMLSLSGFIAWLVALVCIQAKLGLVPFDTPEAETELSGGVFIEYSGTPLAAFRLMKHMLLFILPFFVMVLFMGGIRFDGFRAVNGVLKFVGLVAVVTVVRNTNPRLRIDQAVRFLWGPVTLAAVVAVILALAGL